MSAPAELQSIRAAMSSVERAVGSLLARCEDSTGLRRLSHDVRRVLEDLDDLDPLVERSPQPSPAASAPPATPETRPPGVPQATAEPALTEAVPIARLEECEDEGLGGVFAPPRQGASPPSTFRRRRG